MIIKKLTDIVLGTVEVSLEEDRRSELFDLLIKKRIGYDIGSDGRVIIRLPGAARIEDELCALGARLSAPKGLPRLFRKYYKRVGVYVGAAIFTFLVIVSQRVVWNIEVTGCERIDEETVEANLRDLGFTYGTDFKSLDFDKLHNDYLRFYDDLAWISVNMNGTWATVEVKELADQEDADDDGIMNVVAAESGTVTQIEPHDGKPVVRVGDKVAKGDLLLSGIIGVGEDRVRYEPSDGRVFAEVKRSFEIAIPKIETSKTYTGTEFCEKNFIFFKKSIKLSGKYRISPYDYDKINNTERLYLFDFIPLPFFVERTVYSEYVSDESSVAPDEAAERIESLYPEKLSEVLGDAKLIAVNSYPADTDGFYAVRYEVLCEADIAERKKITIK